MRIDLDSHDLLDIGLVFGMRSDLAAQLVGSPAIQPPRLAAWPLLELA